MNAMLKKKIRLFITLIMALAVANVLLIIQLLALNDNLPLQDLSGKCVLFILLLTVLFIFTIFAIYFLIFRFNKNYSQPLQELDQAISRMDANDFDYRVKYKKKDEFTDTFVKLNRTIEKVSYLKEDYKKAEKRIISLLKAVNESILVLDIKNKVTSFNDATFKLFKSTRKDFPDKFAKILAHNRELHDQISNVMQSERQVREKEGTIFLPDDTQLMVKLNIQPLKEEDLIQGAVVTFKDLHLIKELENNLLRSMKYGVITNLASSISHEIKNPLSAMGLHAEILEGRLKKMEFDQKAQVLQSVETLQSESNRLNRIIEQFLNLARPSKLSLNLISINKVIEEILELVQQQAQELAIIVKPDLGFPMGVLYGDEDQIRQVLLNIILNAFAAMPHGGKISIRTRTEGEKVFIDISDTGVGIPREIGDKIFDLYFTTKKDGGGIGLSVCKNIIIAHDGLIDFETEEGRGTTFRIQLPVKDPTTIRSTRIKPIRKNE